MATVVKALAADYPPHPKGPPTISCAFINAEELPEISDFFDVSAVPYLVLARNGTMLIRARVETASASKVGIKVRAAIQPWLRDVPCPSIEEVPEHDRAYFPFGYIPPAAFHRDACMSRTFDLYALSSSSPGDFRHRFGPLEGYGDEHKKYSHESVCEGDDEKDDEEDEEDDFEIEG